MFETEFNRKIVSPLDRASIMTLMTNITVWKIQRTILSKPLKKEAVPGAYVQYTLNLNDKWMVMAGLRGDYSNEHGFFVTPRAHLKYNPNDYVNFRLSAGKGYRTNHVLAENNYLLSSSRKVEIAKNLDMEEAWNYGASVSTISLYFGKTLNVECRILLYGFPETSDRRYG